MLDNVEKNMAIIHEWIGNLSREFYKNDVEILELKNIVSKS